MTEKTKHAFSFYMQTYLNQEDSPRTIQVVLIYSHCINRLRPTRTTDQPIRQHLFYKDSKAYFVSEKQISQGVRIVFSYLLREKITHLLC